MANATDVHQEMFDAVKRKDFTALRKTYHPDYLYMGPDGVEQKGAEAGVAVAEMYTTAFPDLALEIRHQCTSNNDVSVMELTVRGTHRAELEGIPATGKKVEMVVCNVVEIRDGKVYREREYYDNLTMMQQLGVK
ncbi:MAG: ester cyclase [Longispora sp.]|nr:ester cyclase [Longispora sp. (in: high G+C Gram-positive bacteria)]